MSTQSLSIQNLTTYPTALWTESKSSCETSHILGQTFRTMYVFTKNVEGSQRNYGKSEVLKKMLIEELRSIVYGNCFYEVLYKIRCNSITVPKHAALQQLWSELFGTHFHNDVVIEDETAGTVSGMYGRSIKCTQNFCGETEREETTRWWCDGINDFIIWRASWVIMWSCAGPSGVLLLCGK